MHIRVNNVISSFFDLNFLSNNIFCLNSPISSWIDNIEDDFFRFFHVPWDFHLLKVFEAVHWLFLFSLDQLHFYFQDE